MARNIALSLKQGIEKYVQKGLELSGRKQKNWEKRSLWLVADFII